MSPNMRCAWTLWTLASLSFFAPALAAEPKPDAKGEAKTVEAKAHFKQGTQLYKQARYKDAIAEFETAYQLKPHGVLRFNIAQCFEKLGDIPQALRSYHQYLREVPDAEDKATVQAAMANLEKRLAEKGLQQLLVFSEPPGAELKIDGKVVGKAPWSGELALGKHQVQLSLKGFDPVSREVVLASDRSFEVDVTLQAGASGSTAAVAPPPPPPVLPPEAVGGQSAPLPPAGAKQTAEEKPRLWTWVVAGVAGAALVSAIGCGAAAKSSSNQLLGSQHAKGQAQDLHDRAKAEQTAANVLYGVGGAAGVAGVVLFFTGRF